MYISTLIEDKESTYDFLYKECALERFNIIPVGILLSNLNKTIGSIKNSFERIYNKGDYVPLITTNLTKLSKKINKYNYSDLFDISIYRPIGLTNTFVNLLNELEPIQEDILEIDERVLTPFLRWSGEVLNAPEKLSRITVNQKLQFLNVKSSNEVLDKLFNPEITSDRIKFGHVYEANGQVVESINLINKLIEKQNNLPPKVLLKKIEEVSKRSDILVRRCKTVKDDGLCSKESKQVMADVFYDIGTELSLYGRLSYILISTRSAIEDSADKILNLG